MNLVERFLKYVSFDTQSDELTRLTPSTPGQMVFAEYLKSELESLGLEDITLDENGYLFATLPANTEKELPVIGFIAHMDTSPDMSGKNVTPRIVEKYDGSDIVLCAEENIVLSLSQFPELLDHKGEDLIVTNGKTLLGADDKAGIAEIVSAVVYLQEHPEIKHGKIRIGFNPDEEIGEGAHKFDVQKFGCEWAYTMDGGEVGELEFENFNDYDYGRFIDLLLDYSNNRSKYKFQLDLIPQKAKNSKVVFYDPSNLYELDRSFGNEFQGRTISMNFPKYKINYITEN